MTIGERIKKRRLELGLSVDDIAKKLNKNRATIYRYESNDIENFSITILEPLAQVLNTTPAYLMGWEDKRSDAGSHAKVRMIMDNQFIELFSYWEALNDDGKQLVMDYVAALIKAYKK